MPRGSEGVRPSDEELAERAQQGCAASFEELARRFQVPLLLFLRQRTDTAEAEDLVQDTFVRAYRNLHRYRSKYRFVTWLFTIARRLSINRSRQKRPTADCEALESAEARTPQAAELVAEEDSRRHLWAMAAAVLSERQMTAVWLFYVEEMPIRGIAKVLGRSRVAVKTMLHRARRKLVPHFRQLAPDVRAHASKRRACLSTPSRE
ncbi:MAG TPA: sigma-70 family RNA polymerase sigma factor [Thermoguttaceae bacterium]|nr:sigma-70 family RNA polymerase sigma factor [Thermoguttaceae bacterium]